MNNIDYKSFYDFLKKPHTFNLLMEDIIKVKYIEVDWENVKSENPSSCQLTHDPTLKG